VAHSEHSGTQKNGRPSHKAIGTVVTVAVRFKIFSGGSG
jgi:hypothetical protein